MRFGLIAKLPLFRQVVSYRRQLAIGEALEAIRRLPPGKVPREAAIRDLQAAWGNPDYTASVEYLEAAAGHAVSVTGAILECGSGLSTLMLGALAEGNRFEVWTLEHEESWHAIVSTSLGRHNIRKVHLYHAPLKDYGGGISWYAPPLAEFPPEFSLVLCDGPPNWTTPGARYGLVPTMRNRLCRTWNILLDDAKAAEKTGTLSRIATEPGVSVTRHDHPGGSFLWITRSL
jgi:hypothetical protein